jgi:hypothetical protein
MINKLRGIVKIHLCVKREIVLLSLFDIDNFM